MGLETAAILTAVSMGASLAGSGVSIAQAAKQNRLAKQASEDAEKAMAEAKKELEKNYYAQIGIAKEPYELQRQALLSSGAQAMLAGAESQRGAAATAGRVLMAQNAGQQDITSNMSQDIYGLNKLVAGEDARLAGARANLDLAEAKGAQQARHDAIVARNQAIASAIGGVSKAADTGLSAYSKYFVNDKKAPFIAPTYGATGKAPEAVQAVSTEIPAMVAAPTNPMMSFQTTADGPFSTSDVYSNINNPQANGSMLVNSGMSSSSPFMPENNPLGMPATDVIPSALSATYNTSVNPLMMSTPNQAPVQVVNPYQFIAPNPQTEGAADMGTNLTIDAGTGYRTTENPYMMSTPNQRPFGYGIPWGPANYNWMFNPFIAPSESVPQDYTDYSGLQGISGTTSYYDPNAMGYQSPF